jgi:hypothetical protein
MSYKIFTDATSDLPAKFAEQLHVTILPMGFTMEEKEYFYVPGKSDMPIETFYEKMRAATPVTTAQVNVFTFIEAFEPVLKAGRAPRKVSGAQDHRDRFALRLPWRRSFGLLCRKKERSSHRRARQVG